MLASALFWRAAGHIGAVFGAILLMLILSVLFRRDVGHIGAVLGAILLRLVLSILLRRGAVHIGAAFGMLLLLPTKLGCCPFFKLSASIATVGQTGCGTGSGKQLPPEKPKLGL